MKLPSKTHILALILGIAGTALLIHLLRKQGIRDVFAAFAAIRWGLLALLVFHLLPLLFDALGWQVLFPPGKQLSVWQLLWMRWIGEGGNALLPTAAVGGDVIRARLATTYGGAPLPLAVATILGDITLGVVAQAIFTITALLLLAAVTGHAPRAVPLAVGTILAFAAVGGFYAVQRLGMFRFLARVLDRLGGSEHLHPLVRSGEELDDEVRALYARTRGVFVSTFWNALSWLGGAGEMYIALLALGIPGAFTKAFVIEAIGQGVRAVLFLVPGGVGFQEGGFVAVGALLGIPGDTAIALSLVRRVQEFVFGVPALIAWQLLEGYHLVRPQPAE